MDLSHLFVWLGIGGGAVAVVSFIVNHVSWFNQFTSEARWWGSMIVSCIIAVLALFLMNTIPAPTIAAMDPYFKAVIGIIMIFLAGQGAHSLDNKISGT